MHEIKLPQLGQSVEEASIVTWYKSVGDSVEKGEPLFSVQTDKAEIECEATASGVLRKILVETDRVIPVLTVVAYVGDAAEPLPETKQPEAAPAAIASQLSPQPNKTIPAAAKPSTTTAEPRRAISPRASATALRLGVALEGIAGTGPNGRIIETDVLAASKTNGARAAMPTIASPMSTAPGTLKPISPMRRTVAKRMTASKFSAPHFYVTVEADMSACKRYRETATGFRPTYNDFVLHAAVTALKVFPGVNAQWSDGGVYEFEGVHLGVAVALDEGLIVPVIRDAHRLDLEGLHRAAQALVEKARANRLTPDEYAGASFTVSNLGPFGVDEFTAIINQPGSAILAVGAMRERAVVVDGKIEARPTMRMTLSSDHRVIDGSVAAQFAGAVKNALETADFSR